MTHELPCLIELNASTIDEERMTRLVGMGIKMEKVRSVSTSQTLYRHDHRRRGQVHIVFPRLRNQRIGLCSVASRQTSAFIFGPSDRRTPSANTFGNCGYGTCHRGNRLNCFRGCLCFERRIAEAWQFRPFGNQYPDFLKRRYYQRRVGNIKEPSPFPKRPKPLHDPLQHYPRKMLNLKPDRLKQLM